MTHSTELARVSIEQGALVVPERSNAANLEELRLQLTGSVALALVVASGLSLWITLLLRTVLPSNFTSRQFALLSIMLALAVFAWRRHATQPHLSRHVVVWGPAVMLLLAMTVSPAQSLPLLGLVARFEVPLVRRPLLRREHLVSLWADSWIRD